MTNLLDALFRCPVCRQPPTLVPSAKADASVECRICLVSAEGRSITEAVLKWNALVYPTYVRIGGHEFPIRR